MRDQIFEIQRLYPQIYLACHNEHIRAASTSWRISSQDSSVLMHLKRDSGTRPGELARHLGVAPSTISATVARLEKLGYLSSKPAENDKRQRELRLTSRGTRATAATSVLNAERVRALLDRLTPAERKAAVRGLDLLARAASGIKKTP
ncbi:MAG TPA: MarR family winged helix-turn-helix transcriptional regulator [Pyrinomonadaceae bacterium]|nr:MarR family winged helix-turn-helix transcriptional regulator [Pyrinomonadaceae bacterium]